MSPDSTEEGHLKRRMSEFGRLMRQLRLDFAAEEKRPRAIIRHQGAEYVVAQLILTPEDSLLGVTTEVEGQLRILILTHFPELEIRIVDQETPETPPPERPRKIGFRIPTGATVEDLEELGERTAG